MFLVFWFYFASLFIPLTATRYADMAFRRQVRTTIQLGVLTCIILFVLFLLDNRYRVLPDAIHSHLPAHHPGLIITDITLITCSSLNLLSSCKLDSEGWHRVEKDLYLNKGWFAKAYVHIQRKREEELTETDRVLIDVRIGRLDPSTGEKNQGNERWESRPGGIWLKRSSSRHASDSQDAITAVDILFGADAVEPRPGWEVKDQPLLLSNSGETQEARLSVRRGNPPTVEKPEHNGGRCDADTRTLEFVSQVLDTEKPDLVVLSGDQVNGETAPDAQSAVFKCAELFIRRNIPYATIFGNHDDEGSLSRSALMTLTQSLPLSLAEPGPATVDGVGNYVVEVLARGTSTHSALTLYLLDTHGYSHVHLDMAFIHIPLPEYRNTADIVSGEFRENPTAPGFNSGFRQALVEEGVLAVSCGHDHVNDYCALSRTEEGSKPELWMCYGGAAGFGGYGWRRGET